MMNYDLALISAILETGDLSEAVKNGIRPEYLGVEAQGYWDLVLDHYETNHEVPSVEFFQGICPSYQHLPPGDSVEALCAELKTRKLHEEIDSACAKVANLNAEDPWEAQRLLADVSDKITIEIQRKNTDLIAGSDKAEVLRRIEYLRENGGLLGYPWPWDYVNSRSPGLCPGNFSYFYGREGCRKTFLLCYLANWFESQNLRVLFFTREMTLEEISWRMYPMRIGLPYQEMTSGQISHDGMIKLEDTLDDLLSRRNIILSEIEGGMAGMRAKIEEVKPQVVIHDYMFALAEDMMEGSKAREHVAIGHIANQMKRLAMKKKIPIIACGHANREGEKLKGRNSTEVAGSDKIFRRADYGIRVITDDSTDRMALIFNKGRNAKKGMSMTLDATLCNGFGTYLDDNTTWVDGMDKVKEAEADSRKNGPEPPKGTTLESAEKVFMARRGKSFRAGKAT